MGQSNPHLRARHEAVFAALRTMPPLSHWPARPLPFRHEASAVLAFIRAHGVDLATARRIMVAASKKKRRSPWCIRYDRATRLWRGRDHKPVLGAAQD